RADSPFWAGRSTSLSNQGQSKTYGQNTVVGASYSHADIVHLLGSGTSTHTRPRTPPRSSSTNAPSPPSYLGHRTGNVASPSHKSYTGLMKEGMDGWSGNPTQEEDDDDDDEEEEDHIVYDDDEDEFGLPSLASMRKKKPVPSKSKNIEPGGGMGGLFILAGIRPCIKQQTTGKQLGHCRGTRSGKCFESYQPFGTPHKCFCQRQGDTFKSHLKDQQVQTHPSGKHCFAKRITGSRVVWSPRGSSSNDLAVTSWIPAHKQRKTNLDTRAEAQGVPGRSSTGLRARQRGSCKPAFNQYRPWPGLDEAVWHQISIDVPRTSPHIPLYGYEATQRSLERILYVWAIRHPASGYVQGINDLVTPFWQVFLGVYITDLNVGEGMDPGQLPRSVLDAVEADTFWCLTKLLDGIQDNYIYAQPGIHRQVRALRDLTRRIDSALAKHLEQEGVEFMQFSFRWMNCLLMREMSIRNTIRMWDTYMAEEQGFSRFHLYVCAAFLVKWTDQLVKMDFQEVMMFLQALPTKDWTEKDIELLLSEAFIWQSLFQDSSAHLRPQGDVPPENGIFY
ncbi:hypothetical protein N7509_009856, partial [Penicillium cosmopolitanum]